MLYTEVPFLDRYALAAEDGFEAVEFLFPTPGPPRIRRRLDDYGLQLVLHNLPPATGMPASAASPATGSRNSAPASPRHRVRPGAGREAAELPGRQGARRRRGRAPARHLHRQPAPCGQRPEAGGPDLLIEPINTLDIPGFYLNRTAQAAAILAETGADNAFLQYDIYHAQRMEGELAATLRQYFPLIRHVQLADNPPQRARHRRDQLSLSARPAGPARLRRLGRLRIQARHHHGRRPGLAAALAR